MVHDHTDYPETKPTLAVSKTVLWMMAIAFVLLCLALWQVSNKDEPEPIEIHSELIKTK